jgi:lipopolysaccharide transport system permease protein
MNKVIPGLMNINSLALTNQARGVKYHVGLICHLVWRDISLRYKGSMLGVLWSLMPPLSQLLVFSFVFGKVIPLNIEAFPVFVFSALLPWTWLSTSLTQAGWLFLHNRSLVRSPDFSPSLLIIVNTLANLLHYLMFLPILLVMLAFYGRPLTSALIVLPLLLLIQGVLISGLSLVIATLNVFYRDVQHITESALMFLFFLTPVFYQIEGINKSYHILFAVNPFAALVQGYRAIFFYGRVPNFGALLFTSLTSMVLFGIGYAVYRRRLHDVIDAV